MRRVAVRKLTRNSQITLVKPVREFLGLVPGDYIIFAENGDGWIVIKKGVMVEVPSKCATA